ncbi:hypothetical protein XM68_c11818 [Vibrio alginolyticus]|uniref:hypothetical protein n=2 Tax=Vibrio harveyi group TaxID=717610 RepID=UPI0007A9E881|nr:hypothetical protein [Vibrio alginolyticus]KZC46638.1 hypothetical protein XM68_c11818 [Vibrio alginolyticus]
MENALNAIAEAIVGLHSNSIKDYVFPSISALSTAALGAWAAFYAVSTQEYNRVQIQNVDVLNETLLNANEARNSLIAIKSNYFGRLTPNPFQRMLVIPPIVLNAEPINFHVASLAFLVPSENSENNSKWQRIEYVETLFKNYNNLINIWKKRNELMQELMPHVLQFHGRGVSLEELEKVIGRGHIAILSDLTEQAIMITDDLVVEISCFLLGFSDVSKKAVPKKIKKKYRQIIAMNLPDNDESKDLLSISTELNFNLASKIHNVTQDELRHRYRRLYLK